jgi:hypothetical protein
VIINNMWRLKSKSCWLSSMKTPLLISEPVTSQKKYNPWNLKMSPASSKKTSCAFNTFIQPLPSAWSLPGTLKGSRNHNSAETRKRPKISLKPTSDQPLVHYGQTIWEADFKNNPKTHWGQKLTKWKSVWLSSTSQLDTSMLEAGGSLQQ